MNIKKKDIPAVILISVIGLFQVICLPSIYFGMSVVMGLIGALLGNMKGKPVDGFASGMVLGPLGWLFVLLTKDARPVCPACRKPIDPLATICPFCRTAQANNVVSRPLTAAKSPLLAIPSSTRYFAWINDEACGPYNGEELSHYLANGTMTKETQIAKEGTQSWFMLGLIAGK